MESQPQNPECRNNPESFHKCVMEESRNEQMRKDINYILQHAVS